ncbi:sialate O-acetylesterase [Opitutaceae bacterium TAV5]|nr:sialate O-acetylesterase [Opitutaceae bacterium TAV5]
MRITLTLLALLGLGAHLRADVVPAPLFTDNAVLQREKPVPVWGKAAPGEKVTVTFAGQTVATTADASGRWSVTLAALPARHEGSDLVIRGDNTLTLANVVVGEVWIASGQSNMAWNVKKTYDQALSIPASARLPLIRHIKIRRTVAEAPADTVAIEGAAWQVAGPETTGGFTAVGYYFAKDIHEVTGVPVGIIGSNWSGSLIEGWIDSDSLHPSNGAPFRAVHERWAKALADYPEAKARHAAAVAAWKQERDAAKAAGQPFAKRQPRGPRGPGSSSTPSGLYNAMIHPLVPYALRGAIWYQGESNIGRHSEYRELFPAMIAGWRSKFGQGDFPFYWVQLANHGSPAGIHWALLREAQTQTLALPATGQAVILDIGNSRNIHPGNKQDVGRRLARLALNRTYGVAMPDSGPVFAKVERADAGLRVSFTETAGGLIAPLNELYGFELAGEDKVFKPAEARIEGDTVLVTSADVPVPVTVRYAWRDAPVAGLFNREGLPAVPFQRHL